ncbi:hypothetical protein Tco_0520026 [Tanacetum coccineum]
MDHECFNLQNDEFEEELKAQRIKDQELLDTFKELCDSVIKKQREERERIAKEKEAEELEAEQFSSYDESSSKVENKFDTFKCFSNPLFELDEEIITLEKDVFQNEMIIREDKLLSLVICIPSGIDTDDDSEGDVPPFEEPLDDVLFPLPEVDILPIEVEPVEVMFNDSHTYGENISQVEREFLSMVDELLNLSNDDETFDPGGGENDVLLNNGENNDLNVFTIRTFLPFVTYPEVLPASYSTGSEDKVFKPGIFYDELERKSSLTPDTFIPPDPPFIHHSSLVWGNIRLTGVLYPHFYTP